MTKHFPAKNRQYTTIGWKGVEAARNGSRADHIQLCRVLYTRLTFKFQSND